MSMFAKVLLCLSLAVLSLFGLRPTLVGLQSDPQYTSDGELVLPERYREWTFVTSGFDMSYVANMNMGDQHTFDNVFVNPSSYASFQQTGTWPDKTMLVLEHRDGRSKGSINKAGAFQSDVSDIEVHVKDAARFPGKWAFFAFANDGKPGTMIPTGASCYRCHASHAAVDTTFVQFYPTLLPIAKAKGTLSESYRQEAQATQP
jgi:hypothetical protein